MILSLITNISILFLVLTTSYKYVADIDSNRPKYTSFFLIISILLMLDKIFAFIFSLIPMFSLLRIFLIVYLTYNDYEGSLIVFNNLIRPFLKNTNDSFVTIQECVYKTFKKVFDKLSAKLNNSKQSQMFSKKVESLKSFASLVNDSEPVSSKKTGTFSIEEKIGKAASDLKNKVESAVSPSIKEEVKSKVNKVVNPFLEEEKKTEKKENKNKIE